MIGGLQRPNLLVPIRRSLRCRALSHDTRSLAIRRVDRLLLENPLPPVGWPPVTVLVAEVADESAFFEDASCRKS